METYHAVDICAKKKIKLAAFCRQKLHTAICEHSKYFLFKEVLYMYIAITFNLQIIQLKFKQGIFLTN